MKSSYTNRSIGYSYGQQVRCLQVRSGPSHLYFMSWLIDGNPVKFSLCTLENARLPSAMAR